MTRLRTDPVRSAVRTCLVPEFYTQRAKGSRLITESTIIAEKVGGLPTCPGIYSDSDRSVEVFSHFHLVMLEV